MSIMDFCSQVGLSLKRESSTNGGEYSSSCPSCGGTDRFRVWPKEDKKNCVGAYWCRSCGSSGDTIEFCIQFLGMSYVDAVKACDGTLNSTYDHPLPFRSMDIFRPYTEAKPVWKSAANAFLPGCELKLAQSPEVLSALARRGITNPKKFRLGYNHCNVNFVCLEPSTIRLPIGIVIPQVKTGETLMMKIRCSDWTPGSNLPKYFCVRGSSTGMYIYGSRKAKIVMVVESELDAIAIATIAGDRVLSIATGTCLARPDILSSYYLDRADHILVCYDNDEPGHSMWRKWAKMYEKARPAAVPPSAGKDVGEAFENGFDVLGWLDRKLSYLDTLPKEQFKVRYA